MGLKLLFLDETGFQLLNNNYRQRVSNNQLVVGGAENNLKDKLNLIAAVDDLKVVHYKMMYETINQKNFIDFLDEIINKVGKNKIKDYLIVLDNAKYHITTKVKKFALKKN